MSGPRLPHQREVSQSMSSFPVINSVLGGIGLKVTISLGGGGSGNAATKANNPSNDVSLDQFVIHFLPPRTTVLLVDNRDRASYGLNESNMM